MSALDEIRTKYLAERAIYDAVAKEVGSCLSQGAKRRGIICRVEHRSKEVHSLLLKAIAKRRSYTQIKDKAGARMILAYPDDRAAASAMIRERFGTKPRQEEDFRIPKDPTRFDYSGLHFDVTLRHSGRLRRCEVQLHTPGESTWAALAHDLVYKDKSAPYEARRATHRLRALTELFDKEATYVRSLLMERDMAEEREILATLIKHYLPLGAGTGRSDVSLRLISVLKDALRVVEPRAFELAFSEFVTQEDEKLRHIYSSRMTPDGNPMLFQPESLLMFFLLDHDATSLADVWPNWMPSVTPVDFAALWGVAAHDPNGLD